MNANITTLYEEALSSLMWVDVILIEVKHRGAPDEKWMEVRTGRTGFRNKSACLISDMQFASGQWLVGALDRALAFAIKYEEEHKEELGR